MTHKVTLSTDSYKGSVFFVYTRAMINEKSIQQYVLGRGKNISEKNLRDFCQFLKIFYSELQEWGFFLKDIEFEELTDNAKNNLFDSAWRLWVAKKQLSTVTP